MTISLRKAILVLLSTSALAACSSIIEGRSQEIVVNTNPSGATCTLERNGMPIGTVSPTPSGVLIEKTKYDITVKCNKEGYQEATYFNKSGAAGATFGNIVLGGGIGWAIDSASGSDNKYDSPVNLTMVPEERTVATAHSHRHKKPVEAKAPTPVPSDESAVADTHAQPQATADAVNPPDAPSDTSDEH